MPRTYKRKTKGKSDTTEIKLTFKQLEEETDNPKIFFGTLAYLKQMQGYKKDVNEEYMSLNDFENETEKLMEKAIYENITKTEKETVEGQETTSNTSTADEKKDGGEL